jgi:16S rRNA processing protein RimM
MNKNDFFYLGKILKTHGNNGYLLVFFDVDDPSSLLQAEALFIGIGNDFIPFMIEEIDLKDQNKAILKFEDVNSVGDAKTYNGKSLFLPVSLMQGISGNEFRHQGILGFTIMDDKYGNLGILKSVIELPGQNLLQVIFREKEILIPMVDEILVKTDRKKKILHVKVPAGLIEIYL